MYRVGDQSVTLNGAISAASLRGATSTGTNRLPQLIEFYIRVAHRLLGHTAATQRAYRVNLGMFARWLESNGLALEVDQITAAHVLDFLEHKQSNGAAPRYMRSMLQAINTFFNWCVTTGFVTESPCKLIKPPKVPKVRKGFLKAEWLRAMLDICPMSTFLGSRRQAMLRILITTGMRHMEIHHLEIRDLDWDTHGGLIRIRQGKGQKDRSVVFNRDVQQVVYRYLAFRHDDLPHLWLTEERRPMGYDGVAQDVKRLMQRVGISGEVKDTLHIFRRTWAKWSAEQGIPTQFILAQGGWEDEQMFLHYTRDMQQEEDTIRAYQGMRAFGD